MSKGAFEQLQRYGADLAAARVRQREIDEGDQRDDQMPMFDGPLPATAVEQPKNPPIRIKVIPMAPHDMEFVKRVLFAKYLIRCLGQSMREVCKVMNVSYGTVGRLLKFELPIEMGDRMSASDPEFVMDQQGMTKQTAAQMHRLKTPKRQS